MDWESIVMLIWACFPPDVPFGNGDLDVRGDPSSIIQVAEDRSPASTERTFAHRRLSISLGRPGGIASFWHDSIILGAKARGRLLSTPVLSGVRDGKKGAQLSSGRDSDLDAARNEQAIDSHPEDEKRESIIGLHSVGSHELVTRHDLNRLTRSTGQPSMRGSRYVGHISGNRSSSSAHTICGLKKGFHRCSIRLLNGGVSFGNSAHIGWPRTTVLLQATQFFSAITLGQGLRQTGESIMGKLQGRAFKGVERTGTTPSSVGPAASSVNGVPVVPVNASEAQIRDAVAAVRAGRKLTPGAWKDGARVAVCLSFDVDNEFHTALFNARPVQLSVGEFGATTGLPRILTMLDRNGIPASFYIPAGAAILHPEMIQSILKSGRHEIGVHGWVHESIPNLVDVQEERRLLDQSIAYLTKVVGKRPVGYRAPGWEFSSNTLKEILTAGFLYDSSMMAMDQPYEVVLDGQDSSLIEIPVSWVLDDFPYFGLHANGSELDPEAVFRIYRSEFDVAYDEGTLLVLTMHPAVSGHRSRVVELEKFILYMKTKPGVWFATLEDVAKYLKQQKTSPDGS